MKTEHRDLSVYGLVGFAFLLGAVEPKLNVLICIGVAVWAVCQQRLELLPLLILSNLPLSAFAVGSGLYGTYEYILESYETNYIRIGPLPMSASFATVLAIGVMNYYYFFVKRFPFSPLMKFMFFAWNIALIVSFLISLKGMFAGYLGFSGPMRNCLALGGIFYGYALYSRRPFSGTKAMLHFLAVFGLIGIIAAAGLFHHRVLWIGAPIGAALGISAFRKKHFLVRILGLLNLGVWFAYAIVGLSFRSGSMQSTLTLMAFYVFGLAIGSLIAFDLRKLRKLCGWGFGWPMVIFMIAYIIFSIYGAKFFSARGLVTSQGDYTFYERIVYKMFDDRALLWGFTVDHVMAQNKILPMPGQPVRVNYPGYGIQYVKHGAHNTFLQTFKDNGLLAGGIMSLIIALALVASAKGFRDAESGFTSAVCVVAILSLSIGVTIGHYVVGQSVGVYVFVFSGIAAARFYSGQREMAALPSRRDTAIRGAGRSNIRMPGIRRHPRFGRV